MGFSNDSKTAKNKKEKELSLIEFENRIDNSQESNQVSNKFNIMKKMMAKKQDNINDIENNTIIKIKQNSCNVIKRDNNSNNNSEIKNENDNISLDKNNEITINKNDNKQISIYDKNNINNNNKNNGLWKHKERCRKSNNDKEIRKN